MNPSHPHDGSLPRQDIAVNPASLATILGRSGLFGLTDVRILPHESTREEETAREARHAFEASLSPEQRTLYLDASDAGNDAASARTGAAEREALARGLIVGLALRECHHPSGVSARFGADLAGVLLASEIPADDLLRITYDVVGHLLEIVKPGVLHGEGSLRE